MFKIGVTEAVRSKGNADGEVEYECVRTMDPAHAGWSCILSVMEAEVSHAVRASSERMNCLP